jgi:phosphoribosylamine---glycine ligase
MRVLVIGNGGREHAIAWKIKQSPLLKELYCLPGNPGTADFATNVDLSLKNIEAVALWAVENKIDLTVVGPEAPLAAGLVDVFTEHGLRVFGPTKAGAQLESSKAFAKQVMNKAGVSTPKAGIFTDLQSAEEYVRQEGAPIVIKADGLAAGKGVVVAMHLEEALEAVYGCFDGQFGDAGSRVVIEEFIDGDEASVIAIVDGDSVVPFVVSQDYKRAFDNNQGPNTGGMGAISPTPVLDDQRAKSLVGEIFLPVLEELRNQGIKYVGFLYAGAIVERQTGKIKVLEFNCRLGDPETQVLLPRMQSDFLHVLDIAVAGELSTVELKWKKESACCVVLASRGYPGELDDGKTISGIFAAEEDLVVFQAGTAFGKNGEVVSRGGRILTVSALGENLVDAVTRAYEGVSKISFDGMQYRQDIGSSQDKN